ncbi:MAG TPA: hypothetical protein PKX63_01190, partial [Niabella sp.]|nr:hypothetical protein [Niabella sp.]
NKEVIALNQDKAFVQAKRIFVQGNVEVWMKPLGKKYGKLKALAIMNRGGADTSFSLNLPQIGIKTQSRFRDLWLHKDLGSIAKELSLQIPQHGIVVLKVREK